MSKLLTDRRSVTSLEYGLLAGAIALVLVSVLRVPVGEVLAATEQVLAALRAHVTAP